jgi:hypothetical protein
MANRSSSNRRDTRPIDEITIGLRHRRDLGDIDGLARSIREVGLLHPVVIRPDGVLIAGGRRLEAARRLGWSDVPVTVVDLADVVRGEFAENANRQDFLPTEIDAIRRALEPIEKAAAKARQGARNDLRENCPDVGKEDRARDRIAAFAGISGRQVEKIKTVVEAAEKEPEQHGHLLELLDRPGGVSRAYHALVRSRDERRVLGLQPHEGKFRTLVVDPPWAYDDQLLGRGGVPYATIVRNEALALPVLSWAEDDCHLYLWTTNPMVPLAVECMAAWGFAHKGMLTWIKPRYGMGWYFAVPPSMCCLAYAAI